IDSSKRAESSQQAQNKARARNAQKGKGGLKRVYNASIYSRDGLCAAWRDEQGFRQVVLVCVVSLVLGLYFGEGFTQKALLIIPGMLCVIVELFNSAIENAIDHTSLEPHPFAKKAKDMGSAAQLLSLVLVAIVW
ncbi:hypothetical protein BA723_10010, partial [Helicobacter sp. CLO-3]|uniref:diacylglycerol kinase n=1 Tax=Helicobacter sp. CLO-3 TaxID=211 RepID=UPI00080592D6